MNENFDDRILRDYAEGSLSSEALREFEQRLQSDPDLQAELDLYLTLKATDNQRLKKQLLQTAHTEQLTPVEPPKAIVRRLPQWIALAASLALVLGAVWWWRKSSSLPDASQLAQSYLATPYPPPVATMGEADTRPAEVQTAFLAFRNRDYASAARQLTTLSAASDANDEILFYTGESLVQSGQPERATAYFDRVRPGYWRESADWRTALILLQTGRKDRARTMLEKLRGSGRKAQVETLLKALE